MDALRAAIAAYERLAGELRLPAYAWYAPMWRAALALLAGPARRGRAPLGEGRRIGRAAQDDNAALLFGTQRFALFAPRRAAGPADDEQIAAPRGALPARAAPGWPRSCSGATRAATTTPRRAGSRRRSQQLDTLPLDANWLYAIHGFGVIAQRLRRRARGGGALPAAAARTAIASSRSRAGASASAPRGSRSACWPRRSASGPRPATPGGGGRAQRGDRRRLLRRAPRAPRWSRRRGRGRASLDTLVLRSCGENSRTPHAGLAHGREGVAPSLPSPRSPPVSISISPPSTWPARSSPPATPATTPPAASGTA